MTHSEWLSNEYTQWAQALKECTPLNFKTHPMVQRMLGNKPSNGNELEPADVLKVISQIGYTSEEPFSYEFERMYNYANLILSLNATSIEEIGGGVGEFFAILRALGYKGSYYIKDLPEVRIFQYAYLKEVARQTGLNTKQKQIDNPDLLVSFYALGEFDDETKRSYKLLIDRSKHGYIAWNPHSGANDDLSIFDKHNITVTPGHEPGIKIIQW